MPTQSFKVVEMLNKRTPNSKTWMNFDGSYSTEIHSGIVHYEDENGNYHNINTDLFDEADFDIIEEPVNKHSAEAFKKAKKTAKEAKNKAILNRDLYDYQGLKVPFDVKLPRNFKKGYHIGKGQNKLKFKPVGASAAKGFIDTESRNVIHYQDAWNDTDVTLELMPTGVKETIVLKTDRAPFSFSFEVEGQLADDLTSGELKLEPAWLQDVNGEKRDVEQTVRRENDKTFVDLVADVAGLVYPIEIDPTVSVQHTVMKFVYSSNPTRNYDTDRMVVGKDGSGWEYRSFIRFNLPQINGDVTNVLFKGTLVYHANQQSMATVLISRITQNVSSSMEEITWNWQPTVTDIDRGSTAVLASTGVPFSWNITNIVKGWANGSLPNYGVMANVSEGSSYTQKEFDSIYLEITYTEPPTKPTITSPNGGETWNSSHVISWNPSTDLETAQNSLRYQIQLSTNNGSTWKDIVALTNAGVTSYTYDFINEPETSTAKIRIRAYDGSSYGEWDESDGVFTILHNQAPTTPTNLTPNGTVVDRATVIRLSWQHNDADTDPQAKFDLHWRLQGATTWNEITRTTVNNYYDMPSNTFPDGVIEWQVRTYDQVGVSSPYSNLTVFNTGNKPTKPTITAPSSPVNVANPVLQWSSVGQVVYKIQVLDTNNSVLWEITRASGNKAETISYNLQNNTNYKLQVAIQNSSGLWSDYSVLEIAVSYTPPLKAVLATTNDTERGSISVEVVNETNIVDYPNPLVANFVNKTSGSTVENPHKYRVGDGVDLTNPTTTSFGESATVGSLSALDGKLSSHSTTAVDKRYQHLFSFNQIEEFKRKTGITLSVAQLKDIITKITCNWHGFGGTVVATPITKADYVGKVAGSVTENPHVAKFAYGTTLVPPTDTTKSGETSATRYAELSTLDGVTAPNPQTANGVMAQYMFSFNLIEHVQRKYNFTIPGATTADKVAWLKANVIRITGKWHGRGSSPSGNKAYLKVWNATTNAYDNWTVSHTSANISELSINLRDGGIPANSGIDVNGFVHYLSHADASNGTTASRIETDFVELEVEVKSGYKASLNYWHTSGVWGSTPSLHTNNFVSRLSYITSTDIGGKIDSNGFVHFLAYADPSNGLAPSVINTDYVECITEYNYKKLIDTLPKVISNEVYRRIIGQLDWTRVGYVTPSKYGENLLPPFTEWTLHANARVKSPYELELVASGSWQESKIMIEVESNTTYYFGGILGGASYLYQYDSNKNAISGTSKNPNSIFTTLPNARYVQISCGNGNTATGTFTFSQPMLVEGSTAKPFTPQKYGGVFTDYTPASEKQYEYKVREIGANGTTVDDVPPVSSQVKYSFTTLSLARDPSLYLEIMANPSRNQSRSIQSESMYFAGREKPVREYGEHFSNDLSLDFVLTDQSELDLLLDFLNRREILLYRDPRGRREFVTIDGLDTEDIGSRFYRVNIQLETTYYEEGV
ncbi:DNRLRE domain-containing protein [Fredinandcohnia humi]